MSKSTLRDLDQVCTMSSRNLKMAKMVDKLSIAFAMLPRSTNTNSKVTWISMRKSSPSGLRTCSTKKERSQPRIRTSISGKVPMKDFTHHRFTQDTPASSLVATWYTCWSAKILWWPNLFMLFWPKARKKAVTIKAFGSFTTPRTFLRELTLIGRAKESRTRPKPP